MMVQRKSRRNIDFSSQPENKNIDSVDRISDLHDSILGLIVSNLPTKNAIATTILSKRWKSVWMTVNNLDLCCECSREDEVVNMNFIPYVNRILLLHDRRLLNKFRLFWGHKFIQSYYKVSSLMSNANTRNVHDHDHELFFLPLHNGWARMPEPFVMPISLLRCDSLQSLELVGRIYVSYSIMVCLPRLESLKLVKVYFYSEETFHKLIRGCPMLKFLHLHFCRFTRDYVNNNDDIRYRISLPFLRHLEISDCCVTSRLELEASSLEYLKLDGFIPQVFVQGSLSSFVEAHLGIRLYGPYKRDDYNNTLAKQVRSFDCAKVLYLSANVMWALSNATVSLSTKFTRLTKLEAEVDCCYRSSLLDFIQNSDSLEVLTINKRSVRVERDHNHSNPVDVPKCLSNSLKKVSFKRYTSNVSCDDDREMIGYLLKHGSALEGFQVTCGKYLAEEINEVVEEILKKSTSCEVKFFVWQEE